MHVTEFGDALIRNYRDLERDFGALAERRLRPLIATVVRHSRSGGKVSVRGKT
jgi:molybdenum-dependent DNA-binding transcriptional regulator ModE